VKTTPLRNPSEVLAPLVASEIEVIRSRDPELSKALDFAPRIIEHEATRKKNLPPEQPGIPRRVLRKIYRTLNQVKPLQPLTQQLRTRILDRWEGRKAAGEAETPTTIQRSFTIAFTMRSGSNEICNLLARNGLGTPSEFFQKPLSSGAGGLVLDSFSRIVSRYQVGGVFGSKMSHDHRAALDEQLSSVIPGYTRIDDLLPNHRWVWLIRKDKILQAISWCRAETTNSWAVSEEQKQKSVEYSYDFLHILSRVMMIHAAELAWEQYFRHHKIDPLIVYYEDFFRDVDQQLRRLIDHLGGLPPKRAAIDTGATFDIQRNKKSYAIRDHFVADLIRLGSGGMVAELGESYQRWARFLLEFGWRG
jgi:trehalose 2-sulfotransferase